MNAFVFPAKRAVYSSYMSHNYGFHGNQTRSTFTVLNLNGTVTHSQQSIMIVPDQMDL